MADKSIETKSAFGVITAVFAYLADSFNELMVILAILIITDYLLGITVAFVNGEFEPKVGVVGIIKKLGYICLVILGFLLDYMINYLATNIGLDLHTGGAFGYAITCYLIGNEGMSNLRSLAALGLPVPNFMSKGFGMLKDKMENAAEQDLKTACLPTTPEPQEKIQAYPPELENSTP